MQAGVKSSSDTKAGQWRETGGEKRQEREEKTKHIEVRRLRGRNVSLLPADG